MSAAAFRFRYARVRPCVGVYVAQLAVVDAFFLGMRFGATLALYMC